MPHRRWKGGNPPARGARLLLRPAASSRSSRTRISTQVRSDIGSTRTAQERGWPDAITSAKALGRWLLTIVSSRCSALSFTACHRQVLLPTCLHESPRRNQNAASCEAQAVPRHTQQIAATRTEIEWGNIRESHCSHRKEWSGLAGALRSRSNLLRSPCHRRLLCHLVRWWRSGENSIRS